MDNNIKTLTRILLTFETEDKIVDLSNAIVRFVILDDYLDSFTPTIQAELECPESILEFVMTNKNIGKFKLALYKCDPSNVLNKISEEDELIIKGLDLILLEQGFTKDSYETDTFGNSDHVQLKVSKLNLNFIPKFSLELNHEIFNLFLHNVDRKNLIKYLISKTFNMTATTLDPYQILISDFKGLSLIEQMFIPNLSFFEILSFLDNSYSLFKTKSMIYFGLNHAFIFEIKEAVGTLNITNKKAPLRISIENEENPKVINSNESAILIPTDTIKVNDRSTVYSTIKGNKTTLTGFNMLPFDKNERYEIIKDIDTTLTDYISKKKIKLFETDNKKTLFNNNLKDIDTLKEELEFDSQIYYEVEIESYNIDFTLLHPLREVRFAADIYGMKKEDIYSISQVQTQFYFDLELNNTIKGKSSETLLLEPLTVFNKTEYDQSKVAPFYYSNKVFFNLIKVK